MMISASGISASSSASAPRAPRWIDFWSGSGRHQIRQALNADPIRIPRKSKRPLLIRALAVDGAAKSPFLGARAIFVLNDLDRRCALDPRLIARMLNLTPAQARVAALLGEGKSTQEIASELAINTDSVRVHLKAIFAKTGTHHQANLVALLRKL